MSEAEQPPQRRAALSGRLLGVLALVVALVAAVVALTGRGGEPQAAPTTTPKPSPTATTPTVPEVFTAVAQSVVTIRTADGALGSGVVVSDDGTVLTANHVVADGSAVTVTFSDGTTSAATVTSSDTTQDIANLAPTTFPEVLVPATLGGDATVGADVVAIGNPLGLTDSVSTGVVSGLDRTSGDLKGLIQFDASVNPGSSGGPLLDAQGNVIGIVVAIADPGKDDAFAGIGFAVPIGGAVGGGGQAPQL